MKEASKLSELSFKELQIRHKKLKGKMIGLSIVMIIAFITLTYFAINSKNYSLLGVASCCVVAFLPLFTSYNQLETEIASRKKLNEDQGL